MRTNEQCRTCGCSILWHEYLRGKCLYNKEVGFKQPKAVQYLCSISICTEYVPQDNLEYLEWKYDSRYNKSI